MALQLEPEAVELLLSWMLGSCEPLEGSPISSGSIILWRSLELPYLFDQFCCPSSWVSDSPGFGARPEGRREEKKGADLTSVETAAWKSSML